MGNNVEPKPFNGTCDSCNTPGQVYEVAHAQAGNDKKWHYCLRCWRVHYQNQLEQKFLESLLQTHPNDVNNPQVLKIFRDNHNNIDAVRRHLDQNKQPALEAEVAK